MKLADVNVSRLEERRGWLGMGRDHAEDDPSWFMSDEDEDDQIERAHVALGPRR